MRRCAQRLACVDASSRKVNKVRRESRPSEVAMTRYIFAAVLSLAFAAPAFATEPVDLNTIKCKEWLTSSKDDIGFTIAWLDGYYQDEDAAPIIDFNKMREHAEKLAAYCNANPTIGLGTAAEKLLGKK
jgi:acid stress chaperone HdeB